MSKDWYKLLKSVAEPNYNTLQAIWQMQPNRLTPEQCVKQCEDALHNWTVTALHKTTTALPQWASPTDAINAWQKALEYWEGIVASHKDQA